MLDDLLDAARLASGKTFVQLEDIGLSDLLWDMVGENEERDRAAGIDSSSRSQVLGRAMLTATASVSGKSLTISFPTRSSSHQRQDVSPTGSARKEALPFFGSKTLVSVLTPP